LKIGSGINACRGRETLEKLVPHGKTRNDELAKRRAFRRVDMRTRDQLGIVHHEAEQVDFVTLGEYQAGNGNRGKKQVRYSHDVHLYYLDYEAGAGQLAGTPPRR